MNVGVGRVAALVSLTLMTAACSVAADTEREAAIQNAQGPSVCQSPLIAGTCVLNTLAETTDIVVKEAGSVRVTPEAGSCRDPWSATDQPQQLTESTEHTVEDNTILTMGSYGVGEFCASTVQYRIVQ